MKARLFLSYARADGAAACDFFQKSLQNAGYLVWRDVDNLQGGAPWRQRIEETIRNVDVVLLFLTPGADASPNVKEEWAAALRFRKRVVPLLVSDARIPPELAAYNYRDIRDRASYELEPSRVQKDLEDERVALRNEFEQTRSLIDATVPDPSRRKHLEPLVDGLRLALSAEPAGFPPEVLRMLCSLLSTLVGELASGRDITPMVDSMAAGVFGPPGWTDEAIYKNRLDIVTQILGKVRDALPSVRVPVIIVAMTNEEATALDLGSAFTNVPVEWQQEFDALKPNLPAGWTERYGDLAEDWEPFTGQGTIASLIRAELQALGGTCQLPLRPSFVDIRTLRANRQLLLSLRAGGCLVVLDAISTRDPHLHAEFRASNLDVSQNSLVVRLLPNQAVERVRATVGFLLREWLECEFFQRSYMDLDPRCETVTELFGFRKWVRNRLIEAVPECATRKSTLRPFINNFGV